MNCVVVGGGGFIGSHLVEFLLTQNHNVVVIDKPDAPYLGLLNQRGALIKHGSYLDVDRLNQLFLGANTVFHLASTTVPKSSNKDPIFDITTNLIGTINLLNASIKAGINKVIVASSGGTVYGIPQKIPISENHPTNPISSYGIIKLTIEKYTHLYWKLYGLDYCILRISNAYGTRQKATGIQGIIPTIIDRALRHEKFSIWGDGNNIRDYIYVDDIVTALSKAMDFNEEKKIFNIGNGIGHSVMDIINIINKITKESLEVEFGPASPYDVPINILDNSLAKNSLNWYPKVSLVDGVKKTVDYMQGLT